MSAINKNWTREASQRRRRLQNGIWTLLGIGITGLMLFPFYMMLNYSFMHQTDILNYPPPLFPPELSLEGYRRAGETIGEYLRSSLIYGFGTVFVTMLIASPAAYGLVRLRSRVGSIVLYSLILAQMAPSIIIANSLYALFTRSHLLNTSGDYPQVNS